MISEKQKRLISFLAVYNLLLTKDPLSNDQDQSSTSMNGLRNPKPNDVQVEGSDNNMGGWYSISTHQGLDDACLELDDRYDEDNIVELACGAAKDLCWSKGWTGGYKSEGVDGSYWAAAENNTESFKCADRKDRSKGPSWDQDELEHCWPAGTTFFTGLGEAVWARGRVCLYD